MRNGYLIAIDGPVASGKGTIAPILAQKLNGVFLDTGAMYRAITLYFIEKSLDPKRTKDVELALSKIEIDITADHILLNNREVTKRIREDDVDNTVPQVAGIKEVRAFLIKIQKQIAEKAKRQGKYFIAEGRDIATKVIPQADLKIFLTASIKVRARRRLDQKLELGDKVSLETVLEEVEKRDIQDIEINKTLVKNPKKFKYFVLDNSNLSEQETIDIIMNKLKK